MTLHANDGGTWKSAVPYVNDAGTWKPVKEVWVNDAGTWKRAFASIVVTISPSAQSLSGTPTFRNFGTATASVIGGTPTAYSWGITPYGGSWSIVSGQGTASAVARVTGVLGGGTVAQAVLWCDITVGGQVYRATSLLTYTNTSIS